MARARAFAVIAATILFGVAPAARAQAVEGPPADLDAYVERVLTTFQVPAMAIAVVEPGGQTTRGYGVRRMGEDAPADARTVFPIGSNTKAFTVAALAILVDEGRLSWDDKVQDHLPGFRLFDPYVTSELTIRDLLIHTSGLGQGAGDLLIFPQTRYDRAEIVRRLRYIPPTTSFRSTFAYDNVLYIVAGEVIEAVSGQPWEAFVRERIFEPLDMKDATTTFAEIRTRNRSWPHARITGAIRGLGPVAPLDTVPNIDNEAPAGTINASARDMTRWLSTLLHEGETPGGARLFEAARLKEMWTPQAVQPVAPRTGPLAVALPSFSTYALGWNVSDYRGHRIVSHGGGVYGGVSTVLLIPERGVGIAVMSNAEERPAVNAVLFKLLDHYLGYEPADWIAPNAEARAERYARAEARLAEAGVEAGPGGPPSLPLPAYAGRYIDPWYGSVSVTGDGRGLRVSFDPSEGMEGPLEHVRFNTFRTRWPDRAIEDAYLTFNLATDGSIELIRVEAVSPLADVSFNYRDLVLRPAPESK